MSVVLITGSGGLIGSEAASFFASIGFDIVGIDNNMRQVFFGPPASTRWQQEALKKELGRKYALYNKDIRDEASLRRIFKKYTTKNTTLINVPEIYSPRLFYVERKLGGCWDQLGLEALVGLAVWVVALV